MDPLVKPEDDKREEKPEDDEGVAWFYFENTISNLHHEQAALCAPHNDEGLILFFSIGIAQYR